jgi:serine/threonine protein kinase
MADVWIAERWDASAAPGEGTAGGGGPPRVAVKTLLPALATQPHYLERFAREASIHLSLDHRNIVRGIEAGSANGIPYLALEYLDGLTLRELLASAHPRRIPLWTALGLVSPVCAALDSLHRHGAAEFVHCDVSAENVMVGFDGVVKLIDFGLATSTRGWAETGAPARVTETSTIALRSAGTFDRLQSVAPERIDGTGLDPRSDLYSVGVLLFELVYGARPFVADGLDELLEQIRRGAATGGDPRVDGDVAALVARAMAVDPRARPATARALEEAIEALAARLAPAPSVREVLDAVIRGGVHEPGASAGIDAPPSSSGLRLTRRMRESVTPRPEEGSVLYAEVQHLLSAIREAPLAPTPLAVLAPPPTAAPSHEDTEAPLAGGPEGRDVFGSRPSHAPLPAHDVFRSGARLPPPPRQDLAPSLSSMFGAAARGLGRRAATPAPTATPGSRDDRHAEAAVRFDEGWRALREHDLTRALAAWESALALDPGNRTYAIDIQRLKNKLGK